MANWEFPSSILKKKSEHLKFRNGTQKEAFSAYVHTVKIRHMRVKSDASSTAALPRL